MRPLAAGEPVSDYLFIERGLMQTSTLLLPTPLARACRFRTGLRRHQDYDLCLRLERAGAGFHFVETALTIWRVDRRPDRISLSHNCRECLTWIRSSRALMTERARWCLLSRHAAIHLAREGWANAAVRLVTGALRHVAIDESEAHTLLERVRFEADVRVDARANTVGAV